MGDVALARTQLETARAQLVDLGIAAGPIRTCDRRAHRQAAVRRCRCQPRRPSAPRRCWSACRRRCWSGGRTSPRPSGRSRPPTSRSASPGRRSIPSLSFGASAGSQAAAILDLLTLPTRFWSVGAQLAAPLFDGGKRRAQVRVTEAAYDATVANYRQTVLTGFQQVEDSLAALRILSEEADIVGRAVRPRSRRWTSRRSSIVEGSRITCRSSPRRPACCRTSGRPSIFSRRLVASVSLIQALGVMGPVAAALGVRDDHCETAVAARASARSAGSRLQAGPVPSG